MFLAIDIINDELVPCVFPLNDTQKNEKCCFLATTSIDLNQSTNQTAVANARDRVWKAKMTSDKHKAEDDNDRRRRRRHRQLLNNQNGNGNNDNGQKGTGGTPSLTGKTAASYGSFFDDKPSARADLDGSCKKKGAEVFFFFWYLSGDKRRGRKNGLRKRVNRLYRFINRPHSLTSLTSTFSTIFRHLSSSSPSFSGVSACRYLSECGSGHPNVVALKVMENVMEMGMVMGMMELNEFCSSLLLLSASYFVSSSRIILFCSFSKAS